MRFELHCHSDHSRGSKIPWEGISSAEDLVKTAKLLKFDGIAITDHDAVSALRKAKIEAKRLGVLLIPGVEVSTADGHVLALGVEEKIKRGLTLQETIDEIHGNGGIAIAPHPFDIRREGIGRLARFCDAFEIFNSLNIDRFANGKAKRFAKKTRMPVTVGSDAHSSFMVGASVNIMNAHSVDEVIKCVLKKKVKFETSYHAVDDVMEWTRVRLVRSYSDVLDYVNGNWSSPKRIIAQFLLKRFVGGTRMNIWKTIAYTSLGTAMIYSGVRSSRIYEFLEYE
ncbi:MAG: PHP-associated domain-containing protein [Candidatus Aenigmatarchaeota archaeon]